MSASRKKRSSGQQPPEQLRFFDLPTGAPAEPEINRPSHPIWTDNKARLIERYLYFFVLITKHGTYIDGFAGPQQPDRPDMWAAKLVLESEPRWLRHFHLFEKKRLKVKLLEDLKEARRAEGDQREIEIYDGDFNLKVHHLLQSKGIGQQEATFCLLDQQTFECHWRTVEALARYKERGKHKIELFYFLAFYWLRRAIAAIRTDQIIEAWWGREDWRRLRTMKPLDVQLEMVERLRKELHYKSVKPWPIFSRKHGGSVMYYMIHATDHPDAPVQMSRAYDLAVQPEKTVEQMTFGFEGGSSAATSSEAIC